MMIEKIGYAVQVDVALNLGLAALTITVLIWGLAPTGQLLSELRALRQIRAFGFGLRFYTYHLAKTTELVLKLSGAILSIGVFVSTIRFVMLMEILVGPDGRRLDAGIIGRLWLEAERITGIALSFSALVVVAFVAACGLEFLATWLWPALHEAKLPSVVHTHAIPGVWRSGPAAMWENRIEDVKQVHILPGQVEADLDQLLRSGKWREEWSCWSTAVAAYQSYTAHVIIMEEKHSKRGYTEPEK